MTSDRPAAVFTDAGMTAYGFTRGCVANERALDPGPTPTRPHITLLP